MSKKLVLVFGAQIFLLVFFSGVKLARAGDILINEFVSDPESGSEWIELLNNSSSEINLTGWQWTDLASPGGETEHESSPRSLSGTIAAGGFFVIETTSTLNNTGDSIGLYNGTNLENRVTFGSVSGYSKNLDAPAKGKSGAYVGGNWQTNQTPTKGAANPSAGSSDDDEEDDEEDNQSDSSGSSSSGSSSSSSAAPKKPAVSGKITLEATLPSTWYVGVPLAFRGRAVRGSEQAYKGKYYWNFDDGDFREVKVVNIDKFTHTYFYPGDYAVMFEYYPDFFAEVPDAREVIDLKIINPQVVISRVGDARDFFVELWNNTDYDADISGWTLLSVTRSFTIPKNTILGADEKMIISGRTSGLTVYDKDSLKLTTPGGYFAFGYSSTPFPLDKGETQRGSYTTPPNPALSKGRAKSEVNSDNLETEPPNESESKFENLEAGVAYASELGEEDTNNLFSSFAIPILFLGFVGASAAAVYFVRRKRTIPGPGSDFKILDE